jgi:hypothetical protein
MNKKGQQSITGVFATIIGIALVLMVAGIFMAYDADIVSDIQSDFVPSVATATCNASSGTYTGCGYGYNITRENLAAASDLSSKQGTLTNIAIAVVIISLLLIAASIVGIKIAG